MADVATLTITMNDQGGLSVTGPIENKLLCYGLLEAARDVICSHKATQITAPPIGLADALAREMRLVK